MEENPYAAPRDPGSGPPDEISDEHAIRRAHLSTEASIKSIGFLYYLAAVILVPASFSVFDRVSNGAGGTGRGIGMALAYLIPAILLIVVGAAVRKFKPWTKIPVALLSTIGLLGFPIGTLINLYILYLVFSKRGRMVLSPDTRRS